MGGQLDNITKLLEDLEIKQKQLDNKIKTTEEYRTLNDKLIKGFYTLLIIFGIIVMTVVICASCLVSKVATKSIDAQPNVDSSTATNMSAGASSIVLNNIKDTEVGSISN